MKLKMRIEVLNLLLETMVEMGGCVVTSEHCTHDEVNLARDEDRLFVDDNGYGFVYFDSVASAMRGGNPPKKYAANYVIETQYGYYPIGTWGYASQHNTLDAAIKECQHFGDEYRVVNQYGQCVYPPNNRVGLDGPSPQLARD